MIKTWHLLNEVVRNRWNLLKIGETVLALLHIISRPVCSNLHLRYELSLFWGCLLVEYLLAIILRTLKYFFDIFLIIIFRRYFSRLLQFRILHRVLHLNVNLTDTVLILILDVLGHIALFEHVAWLLQFGAGCSCVLVDCH